MTEMVKPTMIIAVIVSSGAFINKKMLCINKACLPRCSYICRHAKKSCCDRLPEHPTAIALALFGGSLSVAPLLTLVVDVPPLLHSCQGSAAGLFHNFSWLYSYLIVGSNSLLMDVMAYSTVFHFMRSHRVRVRK